MSILFEPDENLYRAFSYNSGAVTYTNLGNTGFDFFPDNAVVGDAILFNFTRKFRGLKFDVGTQLAAAGITVVWEYCRTTGGSAKIPTWHSLANIVDGTNAFQTVGVNYVTWDMPTDWENSVNPGYACNWYHWYVRCRITSISGLTEGGQQSGLAYVKDYCIKSTEVSTTMTDIYNASVAGGWGVVESWNNISFRMKCGLNINQEFVSKSEQIIFENGFGPSCNGTTKFGEVVSGSKVKNGTTLTLISNAYVRGYSYFLIAYTNAEIYNSVLRIIGAGDSYHAGGIGKYGGQKIYDVYIDGNMRLDSAANTELIDVRNRGAVIEPPQGGVLSDIMLYGGASCIRHYSAYLPGVVHGADLSNYTNCPFYPYHTSGVGIYWVVDCNLGTPIDDAHYAYWSGSVAGEKLDIKYSMLLKVLDENNNPVSNANAKLKDINNSEVHNHDTNADGYINDENGVVSSATDGSIDDSSKNWTTNEWKYREVFITSGTGKGQRQIIKSNDANTLTIAPNWDINPDATSKYIIIPYVIAFVITPQTTGTCYSTKTNKSPHTLEIRKAGYKTYKKKFTLDSKTDWTIALQRIAINIDMEVIA